MFEKYYKITHNSIKCLNCEDVIKSTYRHDFKFCKCGSVAVDGGLDYLKRVGHSHDYQELSETRKYTLTELQQTKDRAREWSYTEQKDIEEIDNAALAWYNKELK